MYDPELGHVAYHQYLDQLEYAEQVGFDGIGVNEHHANAYGLMPSPNIMAATLTRRTSKAALVVLGNSIALYNPPLRVAEEFAMLDVLSGGRLIAGFPVGTSMDTNYAYGTIPALTREKYAEAHDLIRKAWAADEPFAFNGRYTKLRYVNCWPKPIQKPHPPIFIPGGGSVETYDFCIDNTYSYSYLSYSGYLRAKLLMEGYWKRVAEREGRRIALPRRLRPDDLRRRHRRRGRAALRPARQLLLQSLPARLSGLRRRAGLPHHQDHPDRRAVAIHPGRGARLSQHDLEGPDRGPLHRRRLARDGAPADGGADQDAARRQHLLPDACRQHAGRQGAPFDQAVRREGDAAPAQPVARLEEPRRPLLVPPDERAGPAAGWLPNEGADFLHARRPARAPRIAESVRSRQEAGRTSLFLHGAGGHMPDDPLLAALASKYRVVAPLLPGYGQSTGEDGLRDMLDVTLHALDVLEALELKKPIVVGHSMGGMIAAEMAAIAHTEIAKLCLLAPAGLWLDDHPVADIFSKLPYELPGAAVPRRRGRRASC